jgi:hypothetical protein
MTDLRAAKPQAAGDLLGGDDADFVVNSYIALLGRWPDPIGFARYVEQIAGQPDRRVDALREIAASNEAQKRQVVLDFGEDPLDPPCPARAAAVTATLRTEWLRGEVQQLQVAVGLLGAAGLAAELQDQRDAALLFEINALRREMMERLPGGAQDAVDAVARLVVEHSAGLVAAAEAKFETRLRWLEAKLLALEARAD